MHESAPLQGNCTSYPIRSAPPRWGAGEREGGYSTYPAANILLDNSTSYTHVPSIFTRENSRIYGCGDAKTNSACYTVKHCIVCPKGHEKVKQITHFYCNDPLCPVCYVKFAKRLAGRVADRVIGFQSVYPELPLHQVIFSPPQNIRYKDLKSAMADVTRIFLTNGGIAGVFWYHPYRVRDEIKGKLRRHRRKLENEHKNDPDYKAPGFWKLAHDNALKLQSLSEYVCYGPHFHGIATGYYPDNKETEQYPHGKFFAETGGWTYKKKLRILKTEDDFAGLAYYLTTHAAWEWTKHAVRYVGTMGYAALAKTNKTVEHVTLRCRECGADLEEHYCTESGKVGDVIEKEVRRRVEKWQYFKRVKRPRKSKSKQNGLNMTG